MRWGWLGRNPFELTEPIPVPRSDPRSPSAEQAAAIAAEAWHDLDWGMFVWLAMTTGARRDELCALRWERVGFAVAVLEVRTSIGQRGRETWERDTKTQDWLTVARVRGLRCSSCRDSNRLLARSIL